MKRTFVFQEGNSQKFWSIDVCEKSFTVAFGRLGTAGQSSSKSFGSEAECANEAQKLIKEKTKKGYTELLENAEMPALDAEAVAKSKEEQKNSFQLSKDQREEIKQNCEDSESPNKLFKLIESFLKKHAIQSYKIKTTDEQPTALDSSLGGIPYLPMGETLPDLPLLLQINFEKVDLKGYPNKGIFQLFAGDDWEEGVDDNIVRYYKDVTENYQKDIAPSNHDMIEKCCKLELEKFWSVPNLSYMDYASEIFENCEIYNEIVELTGDEFFFETYGCEIDDYDSNIGGWFHTPQGQSPTPGEVFMVLGPDLIHWGDSGVTYLWYEDITKIEGDGKMSAAGDMC